MSLPSACALGRTALPGDKVAASFVVTPHISLSDVGLLMVHAGAAISVLPLQVILLVNGLWPVAIFLGLDVIALMAAVHVHRLCQEQRREEIAVTETEVVIRRFAFRSPVRETRMRLRGLSLSRCENRDHGCQKLLLGSGRTETEVGRDLSPSERASFADALTRALRAVGTTVPVDVRPAHAPFFWRALAR